MPLDHCKGFKIVLSFAVFHGVLSELHHLVAIAEEYVLGGGVDEAAGVNVQQLGKGEPGLDEAGGVNVRRLGKGGGVLNVYSIKRY